MNIGIIGLGMVGGSVKQGLEVIGQDVFGYDLRYPETSLKDVLHTELCFVCVPTPTTEDGTCDTSIVEKIIQELSEARYKGLVVIKSTVIPGTTERLAKTYKKMKIAYCPEFLREKAPYTDFVENHDLCVIGTYRDKDYELVARAHGSLPKAVVRLTPVEAELTKYFSNVYNALRIVFANEFYDVCETLGANYNSIKNAMVHRRTINGAYLDCNRKFRGFGGACLPKDTKAFATLVKKLKPDLKLFEDIVEENKKFKTTIL